MKLCARVSSLYSCDCLHSTQLFIYFFIKKKSLRKKKKDFIYLLSHLMGFGFSCLCVLFVFLLRMPSWCAAQAPFCGKDESLYCEWRQKVSDQKFRVDISLWHYSNTFWILAYGPRVKPNIWPAFVHLQTFQCTWYALNA